MNGPLNLESWNPDGFSLLIGYNTSGKTSCLQEAPFLDQSLEFSTSRPFRPDTFAEETKHLTNVCDDFSCGRLPKGRTFYMDNFGMSLDPRNTRHFLSSLERSIEDSEYNLIISTHSLVAISWFDRRYDDVYVTKCGGVFPLLNLHNEDWLMQRCLSSIYSQGML
jgi:hypothetical protein